MHAFLTLQYIIVALAVLASIGVVMKKQFPQATRRLRIMAALPLLREGRSSWVHQLGRRVAPPVSNVASACGGCDNCAPEPPGN